MGSVDRDEIDKVAELLIIFQNARTVLRNHLKDEFFVNTTKEVCDKIKAKLQMNYNSAVEKLNPFFLNEAGFEFIRERGEAIWNIFRQERLYAFIPHAELTKYYEDLVVEIEKLHNTLCQQLKKDLE